MVKPFRLVGDQAQLSVAQDKIDLSLIRFSGRFSYVG